LIKFIFEEIDRKKMFSFTKEIAMRRFRIQLGKKLWIEVERWEKGLYFLVDENVTVDGDPKECETELVFADWDGEVRDLSRFGENRSLHVSWENVVFDFRDEKEKRIYSPTLKRARAALRHFRIISYCPGILV